MGFKISWLAFEGIAKDEALRRAGLVDTGEGDEANEAPFSAAELSNDWSIIWSNNPEWAMPDGAAQIATEGHAVGVALHEGVMWSEAYSLRDGEVQWRIVHDGQESGFHLEVEGNPPGLTAVEARLRAMDAAQAAPAMIDFAFDVPVDIAASLVGFRYNQWELPTGGRPVWTVVEAVR